MTRPLPDGTLVDITDDACAHRLLALGAERRNMRTLYPQLQADPALLSDFLQESALARTLFGPALATNNYGIQLAQAAGCLVAELQDAGGDINIDAIMSQSNLLFVLHGGGVYQPEASANRVFASDLFPVYFSKQEFIQTCPKLMAMEFELLIYPLPEIQKNRSSQTWNTYLQSMRRFATMDAQRITKLNELQRAPALIRCSTCVDLRECRHP